MQSSWCLRCLDVFAWQGASTGTGLSGAFGSSQAPRYVAKCCDQRLLLPHTPMRPRCLQWLRLVWCRCAAHSQRQSTDSWIFMLALFAGGSSGSTASPFASRVPRVFGSPSCAAGIPCKKCQVHRQAPACLEQEPGRQLCRSCRSVSKILTCRRCL